MVIEPEGEFFLHPVTAESSSAQTLYGGGGIDIGFGGELQLLRSTANSIKRYFIIKIGNFFLFYKN